MKPMEADFEIKPFRTSLGGPVKKLNPLLSFYLGRQLGSKFSIVFTVTMQQHKGAIVECNKLTI